MKPEEFATRIKMLADKSALSEEEKKARMLLIAYACDTAEHERLIVNKLKQEGITLESMDEYVLSILPPIEFVDDDEE